MTDLRDKIAKTISNNHNAVDHDEAVEFANAVIALLRDSVKPLEWVKTQRRFWTAQTEIGVGYVVNEYPGMGEPFQAEVHGVFVPTKRFKTETVAKKYLEADYNRRILSAMGLDQC